MPITAAPLALFLETISGLSSVWRSGTVRIIAAKKEDKLHNLASLWTLRYRLAESDGDTEVYFEDDNLVAVGVDLTRQSFDGLVEQFRTGVVRLNGYEVLYQSRGAPYPPGLLELPYVGRYLEQPRDPQALSYTASGAAFDEVARELTVIGPKLDEALRAAAEPWDGIAGLFEEVVGRAIPINGQYGAQFVLTAPMEARFDKANASLSREKCRIPVVARGGIAAYLSIGYVVASENRPVVRGSVTISGDPEQHGRLHEVFVPGGERVTAFLRLGPHVLDRCKFELSQERPYDPRLLSYSTIDSGLSILTSSLSTAEGNQQGRFEEGVGRLLHLCGISVDRITDRRLSESVDILAYEANERQVIALECTVGPLQTRDGKLGRLAARASAIRGSLANLESWSVVPVIVTALSPDAIPSADRDYARQSGILVITASEIRELNEAVRDGEGGLRLQQMIASGIRDVQAAEAERTAARNSPLRNLHRLWQR